MSKAVDRARKEQLLERLLGVKSDEGSVPEALVAQVANELGRSRNTVRRWLRDERLGRDARPAYLLPERAIELYYQSCGNVSYVRRGLANEKLDPPSLKTLDRAFSRELTPAERVYAKEGELGRRRMLLYRRRESAQRNELWEGDHSELAVMCVPPRGRQPQKVWLTVFIDSYSRAVPGFAISLYPSQAEVLSAMMSAILVRENHGPFGGVPGIWRWDNGLDWLADSVSSAAIQLGSLPLGTAPYSPHQKGKVERFFRTLETECLATLPRYTNGPKGVDGKPYGSDVTPLSFDELVEAIEIYIDHYNLERPHSALDGQTPLERWQKDATPIERRSREELRGLVLPVEERQVLKDGIHFRNLIFFAPELEGVRGEKVQVRFMPHDLREIEVLQNDQFVCVARPQGALTEDEWKRFLATRSAEKKRATKRRRRAQRKARARLVATTESGASPEEATPIDREKARAEGALRSDEGIREQASSDLLGLGELNKPVEDNE